jgi:guanylate kinase
MVNDDLDHAVREMSAIIIAERIRRVDKMALTQALTRGGG